MRLKNLIVIMGLGIGVVYGGVKGYIHYKVKKQVDQLVAVASPFADIEYGSIGSDLGGRVMVDDLVIYPRGFTDPLRVERLAVITPGLSFLLNGADSIKRGQFPERMGIALENASLDLNGSLVEALEKAEAEQLGQQPQEGIACTLSANFVTAQYRELGLESLVFDSGFSIERGLLDSQLVVKSDYVMRGVEQAEVSMTMGRVGNSMMSVAYSTPQLKRIEVRYQPDAEFVKKSLDYCANRQGVDVETFLTTLFDASDEQYARDMGFVPGPGIRALMKSMMQSGGELTVVAEPSPTLDLKTVHLYKPEDWLDLFGVSVKFNGEEVTDLSFSMPEIDASGDADNKAAFFSLPGMGLFGNDQQAESSEQDSKKAEAPLPYGKTRYRTVSRKDIKSLVGHEVRISTVDGKRRRGRVLSVVNGVISLEMYKHGGTLSTTVAVDKAGKIEVLEVGGSSAGMRG